MDESTRAQPCGSSARLRLVFVPRGTPLRYAAEPTRRDVDRAVGCVGAHNDENLRARAVVGEERSGVPARRLRRRGVEAPSCGAITFVQRFGSALQLNVHFHVLVPDGAFNDDGVFVADEAPNDDDVRRVMVRAGRRVMSTLRRFFDDDDERQREIDRLLEALDAASATPQPVLFPRDARRAPLSAFVEGFSLHAATRVLSDNFIAPLATTTSPHP
jgi:hypothetical protein